MFIYPAGNTPHELGDIMKRQLVSYYYLNDWKKLKEYKHLKLFLDSGAFSAFTKNVTIDVDQYIAYVKENEKLFEVYAVLDVIGDAEGTMVNQNRMEDAGLDPLPCFHRKEDYKYLEYYIENYDYMALGGVAQTGNREHLADWLDYVFREFICDEKGKPRIKVHGFGLTSPLLMQRYPFYSVDSSSWLMCGFNGVVTVPVKEKGEFNPLAGNFSVAVSSRSTHVPDYLFNIPPAQRRLVMEWIEYSGFVLGSSSFRKVKLPYELEENEVWAGKEHNGRRQVETIIQPGVCNTRFDRLALSWHFYSEFERCSPKYPWNFTTKATGSLNLGI